MLKTTKQCTKCDKIKNLSEYYTDKTTTSGYRGGCKVCLLKESTKRKDFFLGLETVNEKAIRLQKRRDKILNETAQQRIKRLESKRVLREKTSVARLAYAREYALKNKDKRKEWAQSKNGKLSNANKAHKRRAKMLSSDDGTINISSLNNLKEQQGHKCVYCSCLLDYETPRAVHLDHVIPLTKGGIHSINNVVWSCASCNQHKSDKIIN